MLGVYNKDTGIYNLKKSDVLSTIFKTNESIEEEDIWSLLITSKLTTATDSLAVVPRTWIFDNSNKS